MRFFTWLRVCFKHPRAVVSMLWQDWTHSRRDFYRSAPRLDCNGNLTVRGRVYAERVVDGKTVRAKGEVTMLAEVTRVNGSRETYLADAYGNWRKR